MRKFDDTKRFLKNIYLSSTPYYFHISLTKNKSTMTAVYVQILSSIAPLDNNSAIGLRPCRRGQQTIPNKWLPLLPGCFTWVSLDGVYFITAATDPD